MTVKQEYEHMKSELRTWNNCTPKILSDKYKKQDECPAYFYI